MSLVFLPTELKLKIFKFLNSEDVLKIRLVSKYYKFLVDKEMHRKCYQKLSQSKNFNINLIRRFISESFYPPCVWPIMQETDQQSSIYTTLCNGEKFIYSILESAINHFDENFFKINYTLILLDLLKQIDPKFKFHRDEYQAIWNFTINEIKINKIWTRFYFDKLFLELDHGKVITLLQRIFMILTRYKTIIVNKEHNDIRFFITNPIEFANKLVTVDFDTKYYINCELRIISDRNSTNCFIFGSNFEGLQDFQVDFKLQSFRLGKG